MIRILATSFVVMSLAFAADGPDAPSITFAKDVRPILENNCQSCHRPGQVAPMSFLTYQEVRPWAKAIRAAVATGKMPPWFADPKFGEFTNNHALKQSEIETLVAWVDRGALEGDAKAAPPPKQWPADGWQIKPDMIIESEDFDVPAKGAIDWFWVAVPSKIPQDMWVTSVEFLPLDPAVLHHAGIAVVPHSPDVKYGEPIWMKVEKDADLVSLPGKAQEAALRTINVGVEDTYVPGHALADYRIYNAAKLIPANSDIYFQLHYTPNGKAVRTHLKVGLTFAKETPKRRIFLQSVFGAKDPEHFRIPANMADWAATPAEVTFAQDVEIVSMMPHTHVRGKQMTYTLTYPTGETQTILDVPNYDFNWQLEYDTSIKVPKGTKLRVDAHYNNSVNNKFNPNPNRDVFFGQQSWEEMMVAYLGVVVDDKPDLCSFKDLFSYRSPGVTTYGPKSYDFRPQGGCRADQGPPTTVAAGR